MKKRSILISLVAIMALMVATTSVALADDTNYGSAGAASDESYTLEEMLVYAIQDEYMAQAEYDAVMDTFNTSRPFSNIIKSEATHIQLLLPLFQTYGYAVPLNNAADLTVLPSSLEETYQIGVQAELNNIAMYQAFLKEDLPQDVELVFERLMKASESHLKAFQNAADGNPAGSQVRSMAGNGFHQGADRWSSTSPVGNGTRGNHRGFGNGFSQTCLLNQ